MHRVQLPIPSDALPALDGDRAGTAGPPRVGLWDPRVRRKSTAKASAELGPYLTVPAARLRELQALGQAGGICKF